MVSSVFYLLFLQTTKTIMNSPFLSILTSLIFAKLIYFLLKNNKKLHPLPPGPTRLPIIGNLHQLGSSPHKTIQQLSKTYGPIMFLQFGSVPTIIVSSADVVKDIFKTHDLVFSGRPSNLYVAKKITYNLKAISFAPHDETWREMRKIVILELLSAKRVQSFQHVRHEEMGIMLRFIKNSSSSINLNSLVFLVTNSITCRVVFGKKYDDGGGGGGGVGGGASRFDEVLHKTQALLGGFCVSDYFPWMKWINKFNGLETTVEKVFDELDRFYDEAISEHVDLKRCKLEHEDLVDVLLRIQKDPNQKISISNEQIKGVLTDMFNAGTDTSASSVVWTMAELIKNPSIMKLAQNEVRTIAKGRKTVVENDLSKLPYLKSVIKESLRLHPPIPLLIPRETIEDCIIQGYKVDAKTRVFIDARSIGTDPKYWVNPNEFVPERFLDSSVDFRGQSYEFIPFGVGRRGCPGISFGVMLVEFIVANLLYCFDWELPHGMKLEDLDMEEVFGLTMFKKIPLCLVATSMNI